MSDPQINGLSDKAALILCAISQAADLADLDCGDINKMSNWLLLIDAAASHAHFLLTGENVSEGRVK